MKDKRTAPQPIRRVGRFCSFGSVGVEHRRRHGRNDRATQVRGRGLGVDNLVAVHQDEPNRAGLLVALAGVQP